jgi:N-acylneuraminate cytidylyltransferase
MTNSVAFILARGGSKRVPRKNVRAFCGKPMVAWPVLQAKQSGLFSSIIISTDDKEIADVAVQNGASFFNLRPQFLSDDFIGTEDVIAYELEAYKTRTGVLPDYCCILYGTSVFISNLLLRQGMEKFTNPKIELVMAVIAYSHPIERALVFDDYDLLHYRQPEFVDTRTQDIPVSYHDAGLFYYIKPESFLKNTKKSLLPLVRTAIVVDAFSVIDIDNEDDWRHAEKLAQLNGLSKICDLD